MEQYPNMVTDSSQILVEQIVKVLKKDPKDFALWKACKDNDICFESSLGSGRPGLAY